MIYLLEFFRVQLSVSVLLGLVFVPKVWTFLHSKAHYKKVLSRRLGYCVTAEHRLSVQIISSLGGDLKLFVLISDTLQSNLH